MKGNRQKTILEAKTHNRLWYEGGGRRGGTKICGFAQ